MKKKKTLTTTKLIRMTEEQKTKAKGNEYNSIVRLIADVWGSRKGKVLADIIRTTVNK